MTTTATPARPAVPAAARRAWPDWLLEVGVGLVVAVVYLLTLSGNHSELEDSMTYTNRIRDDPHSQFFEGIHVIFDWVAWAVYEVVRATGITEDPLRTIQVFDALLAAVTVALLARILVRGGVSRPAALVGCGIFAFSYSFWHNSVEVDVRSLSAFTLVLSLGAAWRATEWPSVRAFVVLGALNGCAVLAHVTNVLFAGVAIAAMLLARRERPLSAVGRWFGAYAVTASAVVVPIYAIAAVVRDLGTPKAFWDWFTAETHGGSYGQIALGSVKDAVVGCGRALVGGHFALALHSVHRFVDVHFPAKPLREEYYFLRGYSTALAAALLAATVVVALLIVALAAQWLSRRLRLGLNGRLRTLSVLCVVWVVVYATLFTIWDPFNLELWYVFWLPVALLLALPLAAGRTSRLRLGAGVAVVVGLFAVNLLGSALPQRSNAKDYWRVRATWYRTHVHHDDLIISYEYIWSNYLAYLTPAQVVDAQAFFKRMPRAEAARRVQEIANSSHARRVFISDYNFDPYPGNPAACNDGMHTCENAALLRRLLLPRSHVVARTPLEKVWEYRRPG
ncbi:MAG TPA: glycosyltransferase family 39 protein [Gaiellaceae bacterium]